MMIRTSIIVAILALVPSKSFSDDAAGTAVIPALSKKAGKLLSDYKLDDDFKGFAISGRDNEAGAVVELFSPYTADGEKSFVGVKVVSGQDGLIQAVSPIFKDLPAGHRIVSWGLASFQEDRISFDALWEISFASLGSEITKRQVLTLLANALHGSPDIRHFDSIPIRKDGPFWKAFSGNNEDSPIQNNRVNLRPYFGKFDE